MSDRATTIEQLLRTAFVPTELLIKDQSHMHVGHAGAREGKGHFDVKIVSDKFTGHSRINRHRMVYDALGSFMDTDVHALRITTISSRD
ncbi:MAG: BolA family transcriptional regulator [Proteobacteria bacterium]|nr:BolA family transcriptional regulator [Pseudomonadota bacterium]MDA1064573.1 BolA family transcriptional regulator [Pseudomonadota bacterium]